MEKILFPTDLSVCSVKAFEYALDLARALNTKIDLLRIFHLPIHDASTIPYHQIDEMIAEQEKQIRGEVELLVEEHKAYDVIDNIRVDYGIFVAQEIVDEAKDRSHGLIVMGTKGERNPIEKFLGSVTTQTMMNAPCPVMAIPGDAKFSPIKRIAYATDFHPADQSYFEQLIDFAQIFDAQIKVVHVVKGEDVDTPEARSISIKGLPDRFADLAVISGKSVMSGLEKYLEEEDIQLLSLFIPRRRLWERLFHSSFTKKMTFHSKIPLLVFKE